MQNFLIKTIMALTILCLSPYSLANCDLSLNISQTQPPVSIDPYNIDDASVSQTTSFNVTNNGSSACFFFLTLDEGQYVGTSQYDRNARTTNALYSHDLAYQLYQTTVSTSHIVKTFTDANYDTNHVIGPFSINAGQSVQSNFIIHVPATGTPNVLSGLYQDQVQLILYQNDQSPIGNCLSTECTVVSHTPITLQFDVSEYIRLSLGSVYSNQLFLDFGELEEGESQNFVIRLESNSTNACHVKATSEHGGKLVREGASVINSNNSVDYIFKLLAGQGGFDLATIVYVPSYTVDLQANTAIDIFSFRYFCGPITTSTTVEYFDRFKNFPVNIEIGDVSNKASGTYQDTITLEISGL